MAKRVYDNLKHLWTVCLRRGSVRPTNPELIERRASINPAELTRDITRLQNILTALAKAKTDDMVLIAEEAERRRLNKQKGGVRVVG